MHALWECQCPFFCQSNEGCPHFAPEYDHEDLPGKKTVSLGSDPCALLSEPSSSDNTMGVQVGMKVVCPGLELDNESPGSPPNYLGSLRSLKRASLAFLMKVSWNTFWLSSHTSLRLSGMVKMV